MDPLTASTGYFDNWGDAFMASLQSAWIRLVDFLPQLLGALVILIIGLLAASALGKIVKQLMVYTHLDNLLEKMEIKAEARKLNINLSFAGLVGWTVKWFFIIVTFIAVADILSVNQITQFFESVLLYLPNVLAAIFILAIGMVVGRFVHDLVDHAVAASRLQANLRGVLAPTAKWSIFIFALMAALVQLGIAQDLIRILFAGFVFMVALAGGLAFGLGGRDQAGRILGKMGEGRM